MTETSVLTLISISVPRITAVARKRSILPKAVQVAGGRLQLNTHASYACGFKEGGTVNWCMVVWCTEKLRQDGSSFMWHQPCNNQTGL